MKCIEKLLNANKDTTIGNYSIQFLDPRTAKLYMYGACIADVYFGDNWGRGSWFAVHTVGMGAVGTRARNSVINTLSNQKFTNKSAKMAQ